MPDNPDYNSIFNCSPFPSLIISADPPCYTVADVNKAYAQISGNEKKDLIGKEFFSVISAIYSTGQSGLSEDFKYSLESVLTKETSHEMDIRLDEKSGAAGTESRYWKPVNSPVPDRNGDVAYILHTMTDVTERIEREGKLRNIIDHSTNMFYSHATDGSVNYVSPQCKDFFDYDPLKSLWKWTEFLTDNPANELGIEATRRAIDTGKRQPPYELQLQKRTGEIIWVEVNETPIVKNGKTVEIVGSLTDITAAKSFEENLVSVNKKLENAQLIAKTGYWEQDLKTGELYWSDEVYRICGFDKEAFIPDSQAIMNIVHPDDLDDFVKLNEHALTARSEYNSRFRIVLPDKSVKWVLENGSLKTDKNGNVVKFEGTIQDITDQIRQKNELLSSLREKETLLTEIHHRVKNNLAVVSSLLELQKISIPHEDVQKALTDSQLRIRSMAMIHEKLYQSEWLSRIDLDDVLNDLIPVVRYVLDNGNRITVRIECEPIQLNVNQAIPCTLIINELVSNAFEHAFQYQEKGKIEIRVTRSGDFISIVIEDNGRGFREDILKGKIESMGYTIVKTLIKQLNAELKLENRNGGCIRFSFKRDAIKGSSSLLID